MPMQQFLRMGRGAVIQLDTQENDEVWILANNHPIARGELTIEGDRISVQITAPRQSTTISPPSNRLRCLRICLQELSPACRTASKSFTSMRSDLPQIVTLFLPP